MRRTRSVVKNVENSKRKHNVNGHEYEYEPYLSSGESVCRIRKFDQYVRLLYELQKSRWRPMLLASVTVVTHASPAAAVMYHDASLCRLH